MSAMKKLIDMFQTDALHSKPPTIYQCKCRYTDDCLAPRNRHLCICPSAEGKKCKAREHQCICTGASKRCNASKHKCICDPENPLSVVRCRMPPPKRILHRIAPHTGVETIVVGTEHRCTCSLNTKKCRCIKAHDCVCYTVSPQHCKSECHTHCVCILGLSSCRMSASVRNHMGFSSLTYLQECQKRHCICQVNPDRCVSLIHYCICDLDLRKCRCVQRLCATASACTV